MQKDRTQLDDADVELQWLQQALVKFKEDQRRMQEEEEQRQAELAKLQDSVLTDDLTELSTQKGIDKSRRDTSPQMHGGREPYQP